MSCQGEEWRFFQDKDREARDGEMLRHLFQAAGYCGYGKLANDLNPFVSDILENASEVIGEGWPVLVLKFTPCRCILIASSVSPPVLTVSERNNRLNSA